MYFNIELYLVIHLFFLNKVYIITFEQFLHYHLQSTFKCIRFKFAIITNNRELSLARTVFIRSLSVFTGILICGSCCSDTKVKSGD